MHPLKTEQPYPFNQWWIAAYAAELGRSIVGRTILGEPVVLYRTEEGEAVAFAGVCPHRSFPLAQGRLTPTGLECPYHGFTFDRHGTCVRVPSQTSVPAKSNLRRYPCVERGGLIWLWTGDEALADAALLTALDDIGLGNGWKVDTSPMITVQARYTLLIDNLLDLSHVSFIHNDTIPGGGAVSAIPAHIIETDQSLNVERLGRGIPPNPLLHLQFPDYDGPVDQHFDAEYFGPHLIRTAGRITTAAGDYLGTQNFIHGITPETPHSVHYFVLTTRDFAVENSGLSSFNLAMGDRIQPQDEAAIEAIETMLRGLRTPPREVSCRADTGALKARHRLERQIAGEAAAQLAAGA